MDVVVVGGWMRDGRVSMREERECGRRREVGCVKRDDGERVDSCVEVDVKVCVLC